MLSAILGKPAKSHVLYWEFDERGFEQAIGMGKWKAVRHGLNQHIELYDLETDISEQCNFAVEYPEYSSKNPRNTTDSTLRLQRIPHSQSNSHFTPSFSTADKFPREIIRIKD